MKSSKISYAVLTSIYLVYILLGMSGFYKLGFIFFFPILALPLTIWNLGNKQDYKRDFFFHISIGLFIFLTTMQIDDMMLYVMNVTIPTLIITYSYRKKIDLPHTIAYTAVGMIIGSFLFVGLRQNYLVAYFNAIEFYQTVQLEAVQALISQGQTIFSKDQLQAMPEAIILVTTLLQYIYPAMFMIGVFVLTTLLILLVAGIGVLKKWRLPKLKELTQFKLSRFSVILYIMGWIFMQMSSTVDIWQMLGLNIFFFMQSIFQFVGIITLLTMVKNLNIGMLWKVLLILCGIILLLTSPTIIMMIGVFDTLFDYRKVPIVV
jgi:hypothetical protein